MHFMFRFFKRKYNNLVSDHRFSEILQGSIWAIGGHILAAVLGLGFSVIVARRYGAEMVGVLAIINSFFMLATLFTVLGTPTSILRLIPEHLMKYSPTSAFNVYRKTQYLVMVFSLVLGIVFFLASHPIADKVFSMPHLSFYFALASAFIVFKSVDRLNIQAIRGMKLFRMFALMQVLPQGLNLAFLVSLRLFWPVDDLPVYAVLCACAMTAVVGWLTMEYAFSNQMGRDDRVHPVTCDAILTLSLPMLITSAMVFVMGQTGIVMLGIFCTEREVGYYAIAVKLATLTSFVLQAINSMAGPKFSELFYSHRLDDLFYIARKSSKLVFFTTTPILFGLVVFGKPILNVVFGKDFGVAYPALVLLVIGQCINSISGSTGIFMNMTGNHGVFRNIMIMAAGINIGTNLCLIPRYGINGAAIAAMLSIGFWNIAALTFIKAKFGKSTGYFPMLA